MNDSTHRTRKYANSPASINVTQRRLEFGTNMAMINSADNGDWLSQRSLAPFRNTEVIHQGNLNLLSSYEKKLYDDTMEKLESLEDTVVHVPYASDIGAVDPWKVAGAIESTGEFYGVAVYRHSMLDIFFRGAPEFSIQAVPTKPALQRCLRKKDQQLKEADIQKVPLEKRPIDWFLSEPHCPRDLHLLNDINALPTPTLAAIHYCFKENVFIDLATFARIVLKKEISSPFEQLAVLLVLAAGIDYDKLSWWSLRKVRKIAKSRKISLLGFTQVQLEAQARPADEPFGLADLMGLIIPEPQS